MRLFQIIEVRLAHLSSGIFSSTSCSKKLPDQVYKCLCGCNVIFAKKNNKK